MNAEIAEIKAREILDSRGFPTVQVDIFLRDGSTGSFSVPSGASTGEHEALELRDQDPKRYLGKGVLKAVSNINQIIRSALMGEKVDDQETIDNILLNLDGTHNKSHLGANAILGVSMAAAQAAACFHRKPLYVYLQEGVAKMPLPMMNILNGGVHADNGLDIQEFMIIPHGFSNFKESLRAGVEIFQSLKKILHQKNLVTAVGDEGGFSPRLDNTEQALNWILEAIFQAGFKVGTEVSLAIDAAASEFYDRTQKIYNLRERPIQV